MTFFFVQVDEFLADVRSELMRNALGVVLKAVAAKANKRFHIDSSNDVSSGDAEYENEGDSRGEGGSSSRGMRLNVFSPKTRGTASSAASDHPTAATASSGARLVPTRPVTSSPLTLTSHTAVSSLSVEGTDQQRNGKFYKLFHRHERNRQSNDSSSSKVSDNLEMLFIYFC